MLAIKLKRIGKKHQATFRVIVAEKKSKMTGIYTDDLGFWNPHTKKASINKERAEHWIKVGAQPTETVYNLLVKNQIIKGTKKPVHGKKKEKKAK